MPASDPILARPAAAVVLARDHIGGSIEVFMVRRHIRSEFVPDAYVFPGGTVKSADAETETSSYCAPISPADANGPTALGRGFRVAALRECFEEAGVLLAWRDGQPLVISPAEVTRFAGYRDALNARTLTLRAVAAREGLTLATDELIHWAHWITPATFPMRFDTHFFLTEMPREQEAAHDQLETTDGVWITPEDALMAFERGAFPIVFATIHQLRAFRGLVSVTAAQARFADITPSTIQPRVVQQDGVDTIIMPSGDDDAE